MTVQNDPARTPETVAEQTCPDWCISTHRGEMDLVTHEGLQRAPGISVMRTDCPSEGRTGKTVLYVSVELELETWADAAQLAHDVLYGFGFLAKAQQ